MDLHNIETYLSPQKIEEITNWKTGWTWLAGGTWLFTEPQPQINTLVDLQNLKWSEIEINSEGLTIGATCIMSQLSKHTFPENWTAVKGLKSAVQELASFKIQNVATVGGNLCLALPAGTFAPVMIVLDAKYQILPLSGEPYWISALEFQTGAKQTILKPGEVLRKIFIPKENLELQINYQRICVATAGLAVSIVVAAYNPNTQKIRFGISGCVPSPKFIEFAQIPSKTEIIEKLNTTIPLTNYLNDTTASNTYRQHITQILIDRSLNLS
ncbi:carbon monoxide dehydrogenase [[Phormidium ambiguum] IAM M-71]|uniref:Carbon monoxide dehydrogenase n=1 Tax=[Phormidium ambiguum] IAM M-71 TaxID=454136 RepID=A0A1U7INX7_9CYAN|nr:FAD binding domain-containing protein [Phormidium ambiguum]OKH38983.1 carbon monoxide dehydrogenase [Phormidium ambiguum IAM M-71]